MKIDQHEDQLSVDKSLRDNGTKEDYRKDTITRIDPPQISLRNISTVDEENEV